MNNLDDPSGKYCYEMIEKACPFDESWYDWTTEKIQSFVEANSGNNFIYIEFSYTQLGKDEKWLKKQIKELGGDMLIVKRELLLQWTYASNVSPFTEEQLTRAESYVNNEFKKIFMGDYQIYIIEQPSNLFYKNYILSIDISGGLGKDYSSFSLIDPADNKTKMVFFNNLISITNFAELVINFVSTYVPNAIIIPERNNAGLAFIEVILKSPVADRLYYEIRDDKTIEVVDREKSVFKPKKVKKETRVFGINTTGKSRDIMINEILYMMMNDRPDLINHKFLFDEIKSLYRNSKGKIEHQQGFHDDILFSYLIGMYVILYGKNTNKFIKEVSDYSEGKHGNSVSQNRTINTIMNELNSNSSNNLGNFQATESLIKEFKTMYENSDIIEKERNFNINKQKSNIRAKKISRIMNYNKFN